MRRNLWKVAWAVVMLAISSPLLADGTVRVLYAGSLVHLMERQLGPAFERASGLHLEGYAGGSNALAKQIKGKLRRADVFISASPAVNAQLSGAANGDWIGWYANFAQSPLQIGYNARSRFAAAIQQQRWDKALTQPGIRIGRTDPQLDPKGQFVMQLLAQAQTVYGDPTLSQRMLGEQENPRQVLPEETLVGRLQSGQLDAGFFYSTETHSLNIPAVPLPAPFDIKAQYTVALLRGAPNPAGAERFVQFLLSAPGQAILRSAGLQVIAPARLHGDMDQLPASLKPLVRVAQ